MQKELKNGSLTSCKLHDETGKKYQRKSTFSLSIIIYVRTIWDGSVNTYSKLRMEAFVSNPTQDLSRSHTLTHTHTHTYTHTLSLTLQPALALSIPHSLSLSLKHTHTHTFASLACYNDRSLFHWKIFPFVFYFLLSVTRRIFFPKECITTIFFLSRDMCRLSGSTSDERKGIFLGKFYPRAECNDTYENQGTL